MKNYTETKQKIDTIRSEYFCAGDVIFRAAIQMVVEVGQYTLLNDDWYNAEFAKLDSSKSWYCFERAVYECARQLASIDSAEFLMYIQKEVWLGNEGGISYQRAIEIIGDCLEAIAENDCCSKDEMLEVFEDNLCLTTEEIKELDFGWIFEEEE